MSIPAIAPRQQDPVVRVGQGPPLTAADVGGKGASLDRLIRLGQRVPPAICITADAFRGQFAAIADPVEIRRILAALPAAEARAELVAVFEATTTRPDLAAAMTHGVAALAADLDLQTAARTGDVAGSPAAVPTFAVRSSALDEDGAGASFAGLHETELGRTAEEVEPAVRRCWSSLWSVPAIAYRARRGLTFRDLAMAVVVQALVPADASAVVFTRHPVTRRADHLLINAIRGLGEPMVSGEATPDTIVVDRASRSVVERIPGRPGMRQFVERGRIVERHDPSADPALDPDALAELVDLALAVEGAAGSPVDIEAARAGGTWFLLQSRPITTA